MGELYVRYWTVLNYSLGYELLSTQIAAGAILL
jgi:hypothetical protein